MKLSSTDSFPQPTKRFIVRYTESHYSACPEFEWRCYAFDAEHARERFIDSDIEEFGDWTDWKILSIERPKDSQGHVTTKYDRKLA